MQCNAKQCIELQFIIRKSKDWQSFAMLCNCLQCFLFVYKRYVDSFEFDSSVLQQDGGLDTSRITVTRAEELQGKLLEFWEGSDILKVDDERVREACDDQDIVFKYKDPVKLMTKLLGNTDFKDDIVYSAEATW